MLILGDELQLLFELILVGADVPIGPPLPDRSSIERADEDIGPYGPDADGRIINAASAPLSLAAAEFPW